MDLVTQVKIKNRIAASIFRSYDIRGIVGESLTEEAVFLIGKALGSLLQERNENQIIIARDGRLSSLPLSKALSSGIQSSGCHVIDIGMVPTPLLYYATQILDTHSGVMLTGSHNPRNYNGLKIVIQGVTQTEEGIKHLYQRIIENRFHEGNGLRTEKNIENEYVSAVTQNIHLARKLTLVIDAGSGVTGELAPRLFKTMGCHVHELFCKIDGTFPHHHPDPSQPENLKDLIREVCEKEADIGLAFDGDGDRLGVVTRRGQIIEPDRLLMLFSKALLEKNREAKIIFDVKCSNHLNDLILSLGGQPIMCRTGHSFIKEKLRETNALLAGEMSGHLFFKDRWFGFDDAVYAGARLVEILSCTSKDCDSLFADIPNSVNTQELKISVDEEKKFTIMQKLIDNVKFNDANEINMIDGVRVSFNEGWGLVRPSNTTPYLIMRFEAINENVLKHIQSLFREWMLSIMPDLVLPF